MYENKYIFKGTLSDRRTKRFTVLMEHYFLCLGKLIGRFYNDAGNPTEYSEHLERKIQEALAHKAAGIEDKERYPPCNVEWTAGKGSRVWCSARRSVESENLVFRCVL